jgi:hypothetical protein
MYNFPGGAFNPAGCSMSSGNYLFAAACYTSGQEGFNLTKINEYGDTLFTRSYHYGNKIIAPSAIKESADQRYLIAGTVHYTNNINVNSIFVCLDSLGNVLWSKEIDEISIPIFKSEGKGVICTPDSGFALFGTCTSTLYNSLTDTYLIRTDKNGIMQWTKNYQWNSRYTGISFQRSNDNGFIIAGAREHTGFGASKPNLTKLDSLGNFIWSRNYDNVNLTAGGELNDVRQTPDGGYVVGGVDGSHYKMFLIRTDSAGIPIWKKEYYSTQTQYLKCIENCSDSGYMVVGRTGPLGGSFYFFIRTDAYGDTLWTRHYGSPSDKMALFADQLNGSGYIIGGCSDNSLYVLRTDNVGNTPCLMPEIPFNVIDTNAIETWAYFLNDSLTWTESYPAFTISNGGSRVNLCSTGMSNEEVTYSKMEIFPNPVNDEISINCSVCTWPLVVTIYNHMGGLVHQSKLSNNSENSLDLPGLTPGTYLISILDSDNLRYSDKFVVY